jgi:CHAT domain-containing protein
MLVDSALAELGGRVTRLIMVPDGPLHRVPWDLLRLPDGRYVVEQYSVSVTPSAGILAALWRHPRAGHTSDQPVRLLAFGDPSYAAKLPRLEGSGREARLVARYSAESEIRLRTEASATYLEHAPLEPYRIIHFATHALVDERSAARTVLALAPDSSDDGQVGPGDLAALRLDADLVVLSGCRTAGGVLVEGEGVQGLTAPLIQAGARSVVASQWRIADRGTVPFIQAFYNALAQSLPVGDALREAKVEALRRGVPPREWAAFTTVGDPLVGVTLREPRAETWSALMLVAALAFGAAGFVLARMSLSRSATTPPER